MNQEIKVLTLWQPWATLFAQGIKKIETRPQATSFRGTYLIHAAQKWTPEQVQMCAAEPFFSELKKMGVTNKPWNEMLPLGSIIGSVKVESCFELTSNNWIVDDSINEYKNFEDDKGRLILSSKEHLFGNYTAGRFAWICSDHKVLKTPIPYKNGQGYYQSFKGDTKQLIFL
jgi:activating signal cointegrator 1